VPLVPVHTWLPDAHTEAPTAGSVILAGLLLKTGVYGLLRFGFPLFPHAAAASLPLLAGLALLGIFYAAWIAYVQADAKRLVAYSSVAHLGRRARPGRLERHCGREASCRWSTTVSPRALFAMVGMIDAGRDAPARRARRPGAVRCSVLPLLLPRLAGAAGAE
jgi:NADH-quinone oxidoreductase subunit M